MLLVCIPEWMINSCSVYQPAKAKQSAVIDHLKLINYRRDPWALPVGSRSFGPHICTWSPQLPKFVDLLWLVVAPRTLVNPGIQVLRFGRAKTFLRGKSFVFIICLKQIFLGTTKFERNKKIWWELSPNSPRGYGPGLTPTHQNVATHLRDKHNFDFETTVLQ